MPRGDLPGWRQVLAEDFAHPVALGRFPGPHYASGWRGYDGVPDTSGHGRYAPGRVLSVRSGYLDLFMHSAGGVPLVAAPIPHLPTYGQRYGRYSVRFRADAVRGYKVAFLLWPDDETWAHGEVDYPEGSLDGRFYAASRRADLPGRPSFDGTGPLATLTSWHTATTQWSPGSISWFLDGRRVGAATVRTPTVSMHWVLQVETATDGTRPLPTASGHVQVDWVVAYSPAARSQAGRE